MPILYTFSCSPLDYILNYPIKIIMQIRGSKKLFSDNQRVAEVMRSLNGKQDIPPKPSFPFTVSRKDYTVCHCRFTVLNADSHFDNVVVYLPGGAFMREATKVHFGFCQQLAKKTNSAVVILMYPKAPTYSVNDCKTAFLSFYQKLFEHISPDKIWFMGDSSGGTLTVLFSQWLKEKDLPSPKGLVLISPCTDVSLLHITKQAEKADPMLGTSGLKKIVEKWQRNTSPVSQYNPCATNAEALPTTLVFAGSRDLLTADSLHYFYGSENDNIHFYLFNGMYHVFPFYPQLAAKKAKKIIYDAVINNLIM